MIESVLQQVNFLLNKHSYETFVFKFKKKKFCFDIIVRKDKITFVVKVIPNIDNLSSDLVKGIKTISNLISSKPLLIGIKNRYQFLEDNSIYTRNNLPFITVKTLENILESGKYPFVLAKRGGNMAFLNGNELKTTREKKNISRKDLSEELGVTTRTISAYESENMRPSEAVAKKIIDRLDLRDDSIFKRINIFDWNFKYDASIFENEEEPELDSFESRVQDFLEDIGISYHWYKYNQMPFELSIHSKESKNQKNEQIYPMFSKISNRTKKVTEYHVNLLKALNKILNKSAFFIIDDNIKVPDSVKGPNIPFVPIKNLEKINDEEEFIEFFKEKFK